MVQRTAPIPWDIYEEHLDEAAFLWDQWERSLISVNYTLPEVIAGPEERLLAHLDGLVLGSERVAERLLQPALAGDEAGRISAAAWALLHAEHGDHLPLVLQRLSASEQPELRAALGRALQLSTRPDLVERLPPRLSTTEPEAQPHIVDAINARGARAIALLPLRTLVQSPSSALRAAVLRALQVRPDPAFTPFVSESLEAEETEVRDAAIEAGVLLRVSGVQDACRRQLLRPASGCRLSLAFLALGNDPRDAAALLALRNHPVLGKDVLWALGFAGSAEVAEALLSDLDDAKLAPLAAEAFSSLTGVVIEGPLRRPGQPSSLFEPLEPDAAIPELEPEDQLPLPEADQLRLWWQLNRDRFAPPARYLRGQLTGPVAARQALASGPMWRHRGWRLALEPDAMSVLDLRRWARARDRRT